MTSQADWVDGILGAIFFGPIFFSITLFIIKRWTIAFLERRFFFLAPVCIGDRGLSSDFRGRKT
jgi:hypothetical protein